MNRENKIILNLGDDSQSNYMQTRKLSRDHFKPITRNANATRKIIEGQ